MLLAAGTAGGVLGALHAVEQFGRGNSGHDGLGSRKLASETRHVEPPTLIGDEGRNPNGSDIGPRTGFEALVRSVARVPCPQKERGPAEPGLEEGCMLKRAINNARDARGGRHARQIRAVRRHRRPGALRVAGRC